MFLPFLSLSPSWEISVNILLNFGWLGYRDTAGILLELLVLDMIQYCLLTFIEVVPRVNLYTYFSIVKRNNKNKNKKKKEAAVRV